jgi:ABC-2 type transport system ATP-binding protein
MDVLVVENVKKSFRGDMSLRSREVLHGVSFSVRLGEILGFLGPNGAGKTTTIKVVLGLIRPDSGRVTVFGRPVTEQSVMSHIGFLPEMPYFFPHLSLREFLTFCGRMSGMNGASLTSRVGRVTEMVGLQRSLGQRLKDFSKGMIQRAGLAQAILHDPDLLILDEPFSGLDPLGRITVRDILADLKARGKTIFFSSHILPDMEALCDRTCIIRDGMIVRTVGRGELIRMGEGPVEVIARGCSEECLESIEAYLESKNVTGMEALLVVGEHRYVRDVIERLYAAGADVIKVVNQHQSLEKVFLNEVKHQIISETPREAEESMTLVH